MNSLTIRSNLSTSEPLLDLHQVVKVYNGLAGAVTALNGIDLQIYPGEFLVVIGKSGSGKTTLVNMITGLDHLTSGEIWVDGAPLHRFSPEKAAHWRGQTMGVVFQSFELLPTLTVLQNVMLPMDFAQRFSLREQRQRALYLLEQVEISEHAKKLPTALSGGQQQRVALARALAGHPRYLLLDEPFSSLDWITKEGLLEDVSALASKHEVTILLVTHDAHVAAAADRVVHMRDGRIVESPVATSAAAQGH